MTPRCSNPQCPICLTDGVRVHCTKRLTCMAESGHAGDCPGLRTVFANLAAAVVLRLIDGKRHHER